MNNTEQDNFRLEQLKALTGLLAQLYTQSNIGFNKADLIQKVEEKLITLI